MTRIEKMLNDMSGDDKLSKEIAGFVKKAKSDGERYIRRVGEMVEDAAKEYATGVIKKKEFKRDIRLAKNHAEAYAARLSAKSKARMQNLIKIIVRLVIGKLFDLLK